MFNNHADSLTMNSEFKSSGYQILSLGIELSHHFIRRTNVNKLKQNSDESSIKFTVMLRNNKENTKIRNKYILFPFIQKNAMRQSSIRQIQCYSFFFTLEFTLL